MISKKDSVFLAQEKGCWPSVKGYMLNTRGLQFQKSLEEEMSPAIGGKASTTSGIST